MSFTERNMQPAMSRYAVGDKFAVETAADGSVALRDLFGQRRPGARISAYAEIACDDAEKGLERLQRRWSF
jgi:hypothetical protein